jgi:exodeoxyribonuclease VII small subunit
MATRSQHTKKWNYEESVTQLEAIIEQIESGNLPLEEVFVQFEIAVEHLQQCETFLQQGQSRMNLLIETLEAG